MGIFSFLFKKSCEHDWVFHGWSYVKCKRCDRVEVNEALNAKLQKEFWEKRIDPDHPNFTREAINEALSKSRHGGKFRRI